MGTKSKKYCAYNLITVQLNKGFSLIELVVAIAVLGILAAIAIPSYLSQTNNSREVEPRERLRWLLAEQQSYYTEHGVFADDWEKLTELPQSTTNYTYQLFPTKEQGIGILINSKNKDLSSYLGGIKAISNQGVKFAMAQCKSIKRGDILKTDSLLVSANQVRCGKRVSEIK